VFRDHTISDLIGFVYSGMAPAEAAQHLIQNIQKAAQPVLNRGQDAVVSIILDGENAWEYYPQSGREFLRRFYDALQNTPGMEAVTISETIARHNNFNVLHSITPGSWISANFNVWIGAPEDNRSWDYLFQARSTYDQLASQVTEAQRRLAYEELLIAEGSDWNWWYGPEHHSANDRDFDELYRKAAGLPSSADCRNHCASFVYAPGCLHPSAYSRGYGPLLRVDGSGHLYRRPSRRGHARQAISAGFGVCGHRSGQPLRTP
jgi:alpha-amylase/alpha-mannosidase (GH57 family)